VNLLPNMTRAPGSTNGSDDEPQTAELARKKATSVNSLATTAI